MEFPEPYSPPKIERSDLTVDLGGLAVTGVGGTQNYYVGHDELDFWTNLSDGIFVFMVTVLPIMLFIFLTFVGVPVQLAGIICIGWSVIWTLIKLL
jgi:hypothetical protein